MLVAPVGAANGVAVTGSAEVSLTTPTSNAAVISVVSRSGVAAGTEPGDSEAPPGAVSSDGGTLTGEGGNGAPCIGTGRGIEMPAPTLTCVTEPSFPGLEIRIEILVLI